MKSTANPFIISGYEGAKYFCDRVEELHQLEKDFLTYELGTYYVYDLFLGYWIQREF